MVATPLFLNQIIFCSPFPVVIPVATNMKEWRNKNKRNQEQERKKNKKK